jgi:DNA-binding beta-propeller fold protein YncE
VDICYDGTNIWVTNYGSNTVTKLNASDSSILGTYVVGNYPDGICFDGTNIWVDVDDNINTVTKLNATDGSILGTYAVGDDPKGICYDGIYIWVANMGGDNVSKLLVTK